MIKQTFTTTLGSIEGYVVSGKSIIPVDYLTAFDRKHLSAADDLASYTMPNGMKADAYYAELVEDAIEKIMQAASRNSLTFSSTGDVLAADAATIDLAVLNGQIESIAATFYDAAGAIIDTGTGALDITGMALSGYSNAIGSIDAASPAASLAVDALYTAVTVTPNTLVGVDHYVITVCQSNDKQD